MSSSAFNRFAPINFNRHIETLTYRFTGREWLFKGHIDPWLESSQEQFYILTGEPGIGKSAIIAKLVKQWQAQPEERGQGKLAGYHFCQAENMETVRPGAVLRSIAAQLGETLPHYGKALNTVLVSGHSNIDVSINIEHLTDSQVAGIYIENLKSLAPREELRLLIQEPLALLMEIYKEERTAPPKLKVLLIDSLDTAITNTGQENIATLLAALSESNNLPPWIKFILTSRLDRRALKGFQAVQTHHLDELSAENVRDIHNYVIDRVHELPGLPGSEFLSRLAQAGLSIEKLIDKVVTLSQGNFLYARSVMDSIGTSTSELSLNDLSALSTNLAEYAEQRAQQPKSTPTVTNLIAQSFKNDTVEGEDLLGIEPEVSALAEVLGMRALKPPLAVGILGGWGSGKSFVMQLIRKRLTQISQDDISQEQAWGLKDDGTSSETDAYPYVGHLYQIYFNSWTYAKADLWSSLMQTIFYELNYQLTLEKHLRDTYAVHAAVTQLFDQNSTSLGTVEAFIQGLQQQPETYSSRRQVLTPEYWQQAAEQVEISSTKHPQNSTDWLGQSVEDLNNIWEFAKHESYRSLLKGGVIWRIVSSELTAAERDEAIKNEPSLGSLGLLIWQEILASTRNQGVIWQELSNLRHRDQRELTAIEQSLRSAEKVLTSQQMKAELTAQRQLAYRKATIIWQPVLNQAYRLLGVDPDLVSNWRQALQQLKKSSRTYVALGCLVALMVVAASPSWSDRMAAVMGIVEAYFNAVSIWLKDLYTHSWLAQVLSLPVLLALLPKVWAAAKDYMHQVQAAQAQLESDYQTYLHEAQEKANLQENLKTVEGLRLQAEQKRRQVGILADQASVLNFVNNRLQDASYGRRLGLIHQISRDLEGLSQRLVCKEQDPNSETWQHIRELFPRGPARVILYIDDLDRCPPDRVVDVLEAVQLLLNTPLFVVVLAIDDRYIARALETAYKGVLKRRGTPSGIDYIEKIIQIPYRTRPITGKAIETYLEKHIDLDPEEEITADQPTQLKSQPSTTAKQESSDTAANPTLSDDEVTQKLSQEQKHESLPQQRPIKPPPPKVAHFTRAELDILKKHCREVDLSPRTAKRLINIYKILKILWFRSKRDQEPNADIIQEAVLAMLVLAGRYPNLMREVLTDISILYEQNLDETNKSRSLKACFAEPLQHLEQIKDPYVNREYMQFRHDFNQLIPNLTLETLGEENFQLALSFCFVGDIGYDPEDYQPYETAFSNNGNYPSGETVSNKHKTPLSESFPPDEA